MDDIEGDVGATPRSGSAAADTRRDVLLGAAKGAALAPAVALILAASLKAEHAQAGSYSIPTPHGGGARG